MLLTCLVLALSHLLHVCQLVSSGYGKLASMPAGGAVAVASSGGAGSGGAAAPAAGEHSNLAPCLSPLNTHCPCLYIVRYDKTFPNLVDLVG